MVNWAIQSNWKQRLLLKKEKIHFGFIRLVVENINQKIWDALKQILGAFLNMNSSIILHPRVLVLCHHQPSKFVSLTYEHKYREHMKVPGWVWDITDALLTYQTRLRTKVPEVIEARPTKFLLLRLSHKTGRHENTSPSLNSWNWETTRCPHINSFFWCLLADMLVVWHLLTVITDT